LSGPCTPGEATPGEGTPGEGGPGRLPRGARALLTAFGLGLSPLAPGTAGSLGTAAWILGADLLLGLGPAAAAAAFVFGVSVTLAFAGSARRPDGGGDPGWVVSDEVAGQALASTGALLSGGGVGPAVLAFLAFRALDTLKPPPIGALERLPGGAGVLADDLGAGLAAGLLAALTGGFLGPAA
jgi:phosphatidylglycerophosphatase A